MDLIIVSAGTCRALVGMKEIGLGVQHSSITDVLSLKAATVGCSTAKGGLLFCLITRLRSRLITMCDTPTNWAVSRKEIPPSTTPLNTQSICPNGAD